MFSTFIIYLFSDDDKLLHRQSLTFLADPKNAHLFPKESDDEEDSQDPGKVPKNRTDKPVEEVSS